MSKLTRIKARHVRIIVIVIIAAILYSRGNHEDAFRLLAIASASTCASSSSSS